MVFEGGREKIWLQRGGGSQKNMVCKGGSLKIIILVSVVMRVSVVVKNFTRMPKVTFLRFSKFKFSRGACPRTSLLCYVPNAINSTQQRIGYKCSQLILTNGIHDKQSRLDKF